MTRANDSTANRVVLSHAQTRATVRLAAPFFVAAAITAAIAAAVDLGRWLPLHLLLAGGVVLLISGVSLMLTVTWSTAPAPPQRWVVAQRWCIAVGAAGIGIGRRADLPLVVVGISAAIYVLGLVLLAWLLIRTIRRGAKRRFDAAVAAYLAALTAGLAGVTLGATMALTTPTVGLRAAHATLNLLGLIGLTIGGTLPFFASTVGRSRMAGRATPLRLEITLGWQVAMVAVIAGSLAADAGTLAALGCFGYAAGVVAVLVWMPPPTRRQLTWAGPRLVAMWVGAGWWAAAVVATGVDAAAGRIVLDGGWLAALVVAGYAQIVWGSLAYLLPMLRGGGPERLSAGFATTRSWAGLAALNIAGIAFVASWNAVAIAAVAVWGVDTAVRAARVGVTRHERPTGDTPNTSHQPATEE